MNCNLIDILIDRYFEDNLNNNEKQILFEHLDNCKNCKIKFEETKYLFNLLDSEELIQPPDDFVEIVINNIERADNVKTLYQDFIPLFAKSLVFAGVLIFILNLTSVNLASLGISHSVFKITEGINNLFTLPINSINEYIFNGGIL